MKISEIISLLESVAHPSLQEPYDNAGLITGDPKKECTGIMCTLDATDEVVLDAIANNCNLVVAHHPIIFGGLKRVNADHYVGRTIIAAVKHDVAIYAIHTNLDNVGQGVNGKIAHVLGLQNLRVLAPKPQTLKKLYTFVPAAQAGQVRAAIFSAGAGNIGQYSECSFNSPGTGTFTAAMGASPFVGAPGKPHQEDEIRIEVVLPSFLEHKVVEAMRSAHPYEEVAFDVVPLSNTHPAIGAGMTGELPEALPEPAFLELLKRLFHVPVVRHTRLRDKPVKQVALCGGAGSFLISKALAAGADFYISADIKYHEFFEANDRIVIADIGHYESEQFTTDLLQELLAEKFPTFAVLKTGVRTNPVHYS